MSEELKPCPFCGGEATHSVGKKGDGSDWHYVECIVCGGMAESPAAWNRRADALAQRLARALDLIRSDGGVGMIDLGEINGIDGVLDEAIAAGLLEGSDE